MCKFFYFTFSGRVLNRFSKDIGQMDELLPYTYYDYCRVGFICDISKMRLLNISIELEGKGVRDRKSFNTEIAVR